MIYEHKNYRLALKSIYIERERKNPKYSLRSFAKQLGIQPSLLSEVLKGKRRLSEASAIDICEKLSFTENEKELFILLVQLEKAKKPNIREGILKKLNHLLEQNSGTSPHFDLSVDHFKSIAEWQHFAILKLIDHKKFIATTKNLAKEVGLHEFDVEASLERLARLDFIEKNGKQVWVKLKTNILTQSKIPNQALRKYHTQMLEKTIVALSTQTPTERYTGTENIILTQKDLTVAHDIFEEAFAKILKLSHAAEKKSDSKLYHLGIHMIRLSQQPKPEEL